MKCFVYKQKIKLENVLLTKIHQQYSLNFSKIKYHMSIKKMSKLQKKLNILKILFGKSSDTIWE